MSILYAGTRRTILTAAILGALAAPGFAQGQRQADVPDNPFAHDPAAPAAGKKLFDATCAACHGEGATGGRGPNLTTGTFQHGGRDFEIFQTIKVGVQGTQMPSFASLPSDDVWRLVTYIKSLSGQTGDLGTATGDASAGESVFAANCTGCHEVNGHGLDLAADLSAEGTKPITAIRNGVLHDAPVRPFPPPPRFANIVTQDGTALHGVIKAQDSFALVVELSDGRRMSLDRGKLKSVTPAEDLAPNNLASRLTPKQIDDVVAYLSQHKARDFTQTSKISPAPVLTAARLANSNAEPQNWPTYWGDYRGFHFSELNQITPANVKQLQARWAAQLPGESVLESVPLVVDGVMYVSGPPGDVYAFDARTGLELWHFHRRQDIKNSYQNNPFNRGVAVLGGRVFFGTLDDNLIALDAHTGRELWERRTADTMSGYTITGAPLVVKDKLIVGMSGGELGVRGYLEAYDPATGKQLWRTYAIPSPGEKNFGTWGGDSWKTGGGATWLTGSYDPGLNMLYWGIGNPGPDYNPESRPGDNLYTDSILALDPDTGEIKWHYQCTPNDPHDWDSEEDMVLADQVIDGKPRKLLLHADRNGFFYVLDRTNGKFLWAKPFVRQTWNLGFEKNGQPKINPKSLATAEGQVLFPATGGTNFEAPSYDSASKLFYVVYSDQQGFAKTAPVSYERGKLFLGRGVGTPSGPVAAPRYGVKAIDSSSGETRWDFPLTRGSLSAGLVGTRGGLVFVATAEGEFIGLDAKTGKPLWHFRTGGAMTASPISYAVDGRQFVAISAGNQVFAFALPQ
ncbi:MAG TPA: PQQ-dependent dehydrogenase, methanol/ethanol family [Rhizomicrobium sp.]|nr:PQQ-dependent dehydrogenase, methanol/ethanol family [Rhizomicrobium sp.]